SEKVFALAPRTRPMSVASMTSTTSANVDGQSSGQTDGANRAVSAAGLRRVELLVPAIDISTD
ncbi:MAG: hypothetical protein AAFQ35_05920, partial [Pseudomonadota bacterium]